jgi:hypothetical protein
MAGQSAGCFPSYHKTAVPVQGRVFEPQIRDFSQKTIIKHIIPIDIVGKW